MRIVNVHYMNAGRNLEFICKCLFSFFSGSHGKSLRYLIAAGHQLAADHILDPFEIFGSMVRWFDGSMVICDCSAVQSAVCLAAAPVFLLGATRHFVLLSCKICAEIVVYRMLAVFLNGLNGNNSSRRIVRNIFSVYFFNSGFKISCSEYSFVTQIVIS